MVSTPLWVSGAEVGTLAGATVGNSGVKYLDTATGVTISTTNPRTGTYCFRCNPSATQHRFDIQAATIGTIFQGAASFYFRINTALPGADITLFGVGINSAEVDSLFQFRQSDSKLVMVIANGGTTQVGPTLTHSQYYRVDYSWNATTTTLRVKWAVDGVNYTDATCTIAAANTAIFSFFWGNVANGTMDVNYDDIVVTASSADFPIGAHKVVLVKPDTAGSTTEIGTANATARFTSNGSGLDATHNSANILAAISEVPPTIGATASGVYQRTSSGGSAVRIPFTTYALQNVESIIGMNIRVPGWALTATANNVSIDAGDGTNDLVVFALADPNFDNSTTAPAWICEIFTPTGGWSQAKLDGFNMQFGFSTDISPQPGAHGFYGEVAIKQPVTATIGQVTETDTSQAMARLKNKAVGQNTETDLAQPFSFTQGGGGHTIPLAQTSETDLAQAFTSRKIRTTGQNTETDTSQAFTHAKRLAVGQPSETDATLGPLSSRKIRVLGQATETDTPQAFTSRKLKLTGQTTETDTAQPMTGARRHAIGQATELEEAFNFTPLKSRTIGQCSETDTAQAFTHLKRRTIGQDTEADTAQPFTGKRIKAIGQVTETDTAQPMGHYRVLSVSQAAETDLAQGFTHTKRRTVVQTTETDMAQPFVQGGVGINQASEADTAQPVTSRKIRIITQATETDTAQALTTRRIVHTQITTETDTVPGQFGRVHRKAIGQCSETDLAQHFQPLVRKLIGQASEVDTSQAIRSAHARMIQVADETDSVFSLGRSIKRKTPDFVVETDDSQLMTRVKRRSIAMVAESDLAGAFVRKSIKTIQMVEETDTAQPVYVAIFAGDERQSSAFILFFMQ